MGYTDVIPIVIPSKDAVNNIPTNEQIQTTFNNLNWKNTCTYWFRRSPDIGYVYFTIPVTIC